MCLPTQGHIYTISCPVYHALTTSAWSRSSTPCIACAKSREHRNIFWGLEPVRYSHPGEECAIRHALCTKCSKVNELVISFIFMTHTHMLMPLMNLHCHVMSNLPSSHIGEGHRFPNCPLYLINITVL